MKKALAVLIICTFIITLCPAAFAHSSSLTGTFDKTTKNGVTYIGKELNGWLVNENKHTNGSNITYRCAAGMISTDVQFVAQAAAVWTINTPYSFTLSSTSPNLVMLSSQLIPGNLAEIYSSTTNSNGHYTSWVLAIDGNAYNEGDVDILNVAHVFGHVLGLGNLSSNANSGKLMNGDLDTQAPSGITGTTASDRWGAKVITGYHTSHTWTYEYSTLSKHHKKCTSCGGYKTDGCTYNSSGYCTKCGHQQSVSGDGLFEPIAAILPSCEENRRTPKYRTT